MLRPRLGSFVLSSRVVSARRGEAAAILAPRSQWLGRSSNFTTSLSCSNLHEPAIIDFDMPPDYESQSFWDNRFKKEVHFEWLGDGQETIVPVLRPLLQASTSAQPLHVPRLLHIGAGTSSLSHHILDLYHDVFGGKFTEDPIVNTDFARQAVEKGRAAEKARGIAGVQWEQVDLLSWRDAMDLKERCRSPGETSQATFDFVADKSTSDAISCGDTMTFTQEELTSPSSPLHPMLRTYLSQHPGEILRLEPLEILALHLASLVRPGGVWIALSYSSHRFPFLVSPVKESIAGTALDAGVYWKVDKVQTVNAPSGWGKLGEGSANVHTPEIMHYLYTFRRSDTPLH